MQLHKQSINQINQGLIQGEYSAQEIKQYFIDRINKFNPDLGAVIKNVDDDKLATTEINNESLLKDIPLIHKDVFCTKNIRTTAASKILENFIPPYSAHIVEQIANAGGVTIGKANMDEFAMGSRNENSAFGAAKNPWNINYTPGGSSGGSAASVAAGLCAFATGSDTGGSIRMPASHCGVTGIKPSYGNVSRYGQIAYASSLDQAGVFARRAEDCAHVLEVMMDYDERDSTQIPMDKRDSNLTCAPLAEQINQSIVGKKVGVCRNLINSVNEDIKAPINNAIDVLSDMGAVVVDLDFKHIDEALAAYYIIATAEASSNLSRYDGIHYGYRAPEPTNLEDLYERSRTQAFGEEVKRRILLGSFVLSHGYYDAYYLSALKVRRLIVEMFSELFSKCDFLALPNSPASPTKLGSITSPVDEYLSDVFTVPINLAGLPAISMPIGFSNDNLPIGLQLTAPYFGEGLLLSVAHQYQQNTEFHLQSPPDFD